MLLASPCWFCAGVERAIEMVEAAVDDAAGTPVYVRKQIVHNTFLVAQFEARGAVFVDELDQIPDGATVVFSADGVAPAECIGDTIRVSLTAPPVEEVKAGHQILASLGLCERTLEIVSCPGCGRLQIDLYRLSTHVEAAFAGFPHPLRVAVMGCVVNGLGEAQEADIGVASGNGKGQIFVRGEVVATVPESQIVERLVEEPLKLTEAGRIRGTLGRHHYRPRPVVADASVTDQPPGPGDRRAESGMGRADRPGARRRESKPTDRVRAARGRGPDVPRSAADAAVAHQRLFDLVLCAR
jgi:hypothetical protein